MARMSETHLAQIATDAASAGRLADAFADWLGVAVAAFEQPSGDWSVELHFEQAPAHDQIRDLVRSIAGTAASEAIRFETIAERDWVATSLAGLKPVEAGRFIVHGAHDRAAIKPGQIAIEVEAALAFGTGHHGTTRGCLLALDHVLRRMRHVPWRILDVGTGSGVLAIAAAKALRTGVLATDIDPRAVRVAQENARLNRVAPLIEALCVPGVDPHRIHDRGPYDLVFANILLGPLRGLARPIATLLAPGARVILSGLLAAQANAALAAYLPQGLSLERRIALEGWMTLILRRRA
ncbi:MAG: 50S ribosomal protein L11 methyltransferase [Xanthobacteraceae bacterium]|nr:50S ribosomal protein L11 methyltransferase [Xanthobacteraceae bacterium]